MGELIMFTKDKGGKKVIKINDVARAFLTYEEMTHKKLQKLCYYAYAWSITLLEDSLNHVQFEAWIHGPVCRELYNLYKIYGSTNIPKESNFPTNIQKNEEYLELIQEVYRIYGELDGNQLEALTHSEEPWRNAREGLQPWEPSNTPIDTRLIYKYYTQQLENEVNV